MPPFANDLLALCGARQLSVRRVREAPEEWRVGRFVIALERARGNAVIRYAKNPVVTGVACDPSALVAACESARARLSEKSWAPDSLLPALVAAYRRLTTPSDPTRLGRGEQTAPDHARSPARALLVEVLADLKTARSGYTRAQFAFDLARLKSERRLVVDAQRVDLGVATGLATQRKRRVLWIEDESGAGQYFETFRLLPQSVEDT